jgi:hypothetical protein
MKSKTIVIMGLIAAAIIASVDFQLDMLEDVMEYKMLDIF